MSTLDLEGDAGAYAVSDLARRELGDRLLDYQSREEWLAGREEDFRLGGSDIPKILGVSPYGSPWDVWNRKKLNLTKEYSAQQLADFERGRRWEARVLEDYQLDTLFGVWQTDDLIVRHESEPWATSSPDGFVLDIILGGVEAKTDRNPRLWGESGTVIERWEDGSEAIVRPDHALQVYFYLEVTGLPWWDIVVAIPRGYDFPEIRRFRLYRDENIQGRILNKVGEWRERYLVGDTEPDPDGSEAARLSLMRRFPGRADKVVRSASGVEAEALRYLATVKEKIETLDRKKKVLQQTICKAIGDDYGLTIGTKKALWIRTKGRAGFNTKAFKEDHPDLAAQYATTGSPYRSLRLYGFDS